MTKDVRNNNAVLREEGYPRELTDYTVLQESSLTARVRVQLDCLLVGQDADLMQMQNKLQSQIKTS